MGDTIIVAPAPEGVATRHHVELALRGDSVAPKRFAGWNLTEADLNGLDFQGCEFMRCRAGHANFSSCNFTEARFLFCDFNNSKWRGTIVSSAFFQDCKLTGAQMVVAFTLMPPAFERCSSSTQICVVCRSGSAIGRCRFPGRRSLRRRLQGRRVDGLQPEGGERDEGAL